MNRFLGGPASGPVKVEDIETAVRTPSISGNHSLADHRFLESHVQTLREQYRRQSELVTKVERRDFSGKEINDLAGALAAQPPQRELQLVNARTGLPVRVSDVGVGVSQILPIVVAALDARGPITAIEQPELHVHPRIQVEIGDLFARQARRKYSCPVFLIESHSEHLLLRLMRRMRQTSDGTLPEGAPEVRPADVNVLFVEVDPEGERTLIREMPLNERGELIDAWPGGFFEEDLKEIF